ncbi:uncharacterized protein LOC141856051 [Brevipalpus obovatus]|uniref:uncharacterized protein LOC141856051 n=1 Tax=Brevipalpus obovatus TaxID=246614 RepID=UPI003D9F33BD
MHSPETERLTNISYDKPSTSSIRNPHLEIPSSYSQSSRTSFTQANQARYKPGSLAAYQRSIHQSDSETLLTYAKGLLLGAHIVFIIGSGVSVKELFTFLFDNSDELEWISGLIIVSIVAISLIGVWASLKEDSCLLLVYGVIILVIFFCHIALLVVLKRACENQRSVCSQNIATPPGLAPIIVAISELVIALAAFFMGLVIESERKQRYSIPRIYQIPVALDDAA